MDNIFKAAGELPKRSLNKQREKALLKHLESLGIQYNYWVGEAIPDMPCWRELNNLPVGAWISFQLDVMGKTEQWVIDTALSNINRHQRRYELGVN